MAKGIRYGTELRASPLKRRNNATFSIPANKPTAAHNLNFRSEQRNQARSATSSSKPTGRAEMVKPTSARARDAVEEEVAHVK